MVTLADSHPANAPASRTATAQNRKPLPFRIIGLLVASLVFSILAEWVGMALLWKEQGVNHSIAMLDTELRYLNEDFRQGAFGSSPARAIKAVAGNTYYYLFQWTRLEELFRWVGNRLGLDQYVIATVVITQVFLVRVGILTFSLPVFVLFSIVGLTSGLTLRDIRRWSGGREFGGVYHRAKWIAPKALVIAWVVYLALPVSLHPNAIILPCAILFGLNLLIISASFKKYL